MVKKIIFIVVVFLVLVFVLQNTEMVNVHFLFWEVSMSRALFLMATFLMGILAGWMAVRFKPKGKGKKS